MLDKRLVTRFELINNLLRFILLLRLPFSYGLINIVVTFIVLLKLLLLVTRLVVVNLSLYRRLLTVTWHHPLYHNILFILFLFHSLKHKHHRRLFLLQLYHLQLRIFSLIIKHLPLILFQLPHRLLLLRMHRSLSSKELHLSCL